MLCETGSDGSGYPNVTAAETIAMDCDAIEDTGLTRCWKYVSQNNNSPIVTYTRPTEIAANEIYTFSFYAKSYTTGAQCTMSAVIMNEGDTTCTECVNSAVNSDGEEDASENSTAASVKLTLTQSWRLYWVTFRMSKGGSLVLDLRDNGGKGNTYFVAGMKLRKGGRADVFTDYGETTESIDISSKLLATGIDIENKKITLTADNFICQNNAGEVNLSMDADSNLLTKNVMEYQPLYLTSASKSYTLPKIQNSDYSKTIVFPVFTLTRMGYPTLTLTASCDVTITTSETTAQNIDGGDSYTWSINDCTWGILVLSYVGYDLGRDKWTAMVINTNT